MPHYQHILCCCDLNDTHNNVQSRIMTLQNLMQAKVSIIHVIEPIPAYGYPGVTEIESPLIEKSKQNLAKLGQAMGIPPSQQYIRMGQVKTKVLELAREIGVDLIVIGSHGRHGISRLLGSSAHAIVNSASCDVLTVRC